MNKLGKKLVTAGLCVCVAAAALTGCAKVNGDAVVATLDGEKISMGLANLMVRYNQAQMEANLGAMFGEDMWNTDLMGNGTPYGITLKTQIMDSLEEMLILEKHMEEYKVTISDEEKKKIEDSAKKFMEENSAETLEAMTATQENVARMLTLNTVQNKMKTAIVKDVDANVSDDEAAQKTINYVLFSTADTTDAEGKAVAMTDDEKKAAKENAQKLLDAVKGGKAMEEALKEIDEEKTVSSGSYGKDDTSLKDELKTAADKLKDGETADSLVETDGGYYVLQMKTTFDEEATQSKKDSIVSQRKTDKYNEVYNGWKEKVKFELKQSVWDKVDFIDKITVKQTETSEAATAAATETTEAATVATETTDAASEESSN